MIVKTHILLFIVIIILSMSCASRRQYELKQEKHVRTENINREIESFVQKGNYIEAIELIGEADRKSASEIPRSALYIKALNGLADRGMKYYSAGDYKRAGSTLKYVIGHIPADSAIRNKIECSSENIRSLIIICEDRLLQQGLIEYRDGNLGDAITIWKEVLKINPNHTEAKKALETATVQLKNLKKIENK